MRQTIAIPARIGFQCFIGRRIQADVWHDVLFLKQNPNWDRGWLKENSMQVSRKQMFSFNFSLDY
jgi:hypothetical protein